MKRTAAIRRRELPRAALPACRYLTFTRAGETYGIDTIAVREIVEDAQVTRIPILPEFVRGVIDVRGALVPVIDLGVRVGSDALLTAWSTCIVVVELEYEGELREVGLLVDAVGGVLEIAPRDIEPAPAFGARARTSFIAGTSRMRGGGVAILDAALILSSEGMSVLTQTESGTVH